MNLVASMVEMMVETLVEKSVEKLGRTKAEWLVGLRVDLLEQKKVAMMAE